MNSISEIGLLNRSLRDAIFLTFILLNLLLPSVTFLLKVIINEFPSVNIFLFSSKISEKINSSNTLDKSVSFIIAYVFPFAVFLSWTFNSVAAILFSLTSSLELNLLKSIIL